MKMMVMVKWEISKVVNFFFLKEEMSCLNHTCFSPSEFLAGFSR